jgi:hypothetical protein
MSSFAETWTTAALISLGRFWTAAFLAVLVASALILHVGFDALGLLPDPSAARSVTEREFFLLAYTFALNLVFMAVSRVSIVWKARRHGLDIAPPRAWGERILFVLAALSFGWIALGLAAPAE